MPKRRRVRRLQLTRGISEQDAHVSRQQRTDDSDRDPENEDEWDEDLRRHIARGIPALRVHVSGLGIMRVIAVNVRRQHPSSRWLSTVPFRVTNRGMLVNRVARTYVPM